jgi:hypothetical protein
MEPGKRLCHIRGIIGDHATGLRALVEERGGRNVVEETTMNPFEIPLGSLPMNVAGVKAMRRLPNRYIVWANRLFARAFLAEGVACENGHARWLCEPTFSSR